MSFEKNNYINEKYIQCGLLDKNLNKINTTWFDPYIYPPDYIPFCTKCSSDFRFFKDNINNEVNMEHTSGCLWFDYFWKKIKIINPDAKLKKK
jgi:hypothetical protein